MLTMLTAPVKADGTPCKVLAHNQTYEMEIMVSDNPDGEPNTLCVALSSIDYKALWNVEVLDMSDWNKIITEVYQMCQKMALVYHSDVLKGAKQAGLNVVH